MTQELRPHLLSQLKSAGLDLEKVVYDLRPQLPYHLLICLTCSHTHLLDICLPLNQIPTPILHLDLPEWILLSVELVTCKHLINVSMHVCDTRTCFVCLHLCVCVCRRTCVSLCMKARGPHWVFLSIILQFILRE